MKLLLFTDRDGTLVHNKHFLGKNTNWKDEVELNEPVITFLQMLQKEYELTIVCVTNQAGVAWGYFTEEQVENINHYIGDALAARGIHIAHWEYAPQVDELFAQRKGKEQFIQKHVLPKTTRKPDPTMAHAALKALRVKFTDFDRCVMIGDSDDDAGFAKNLGITYIDVSGKNNQTLTSLFKARVL